MRFGTVRGHRRSGKAAGHFAEDENPKADEEDQEHSAGQRAFVAAVDVKLFGSFQSNDRLGRRGSR